MKENDERADIPALRDVLAAVLDFDPTREAIEYRGRSCSWGELAKAIADLQAQFANLPQGARIGVLLRNRPPQLAAALAVLGADYCLVTLNPAYPDVTLTADIAMLDLPLLIGEASDLARPGVIDAVGGGGIIELGAWPGCRAQLTVPWQKRETVATGAAIEMLSSGTTGKPKRVLLDRVRFNQALAPAIAQEATEDGRFDARLRDGCRIVSAPLTHIGGIWGTLRCVIGGRRAVLLEKFVLADWIEAVRRHRPTVVAVTPAALRMILDADVSREDLSSLKALTVGTAPTDPSLIDMFWTRYRVPVLVNYGATEFGGPVASWSLEDFHAFRESRRGSVGRLYPGVDARAVDAASGMPLPTGTDGLIELCGEQFNEGVWLRTTDRGRIDEERFLWITGRADTAILRGGFKVHPEDVVTALEAHHAVREAAVVGIDDARLGQVPAAMIILREGSGFDEAALRNHLRAHLLPYQLPVRIVPVDELPRTDSMKPALAEIRKRIAASA